MKDKLMALAGDLREQAASAYRTVFSMATLSRIEHVKEYQELQRYTNSLAQAMIDAADELEQVAAETDIKELLTGMDWVHPDESSYIYLKYEHFGSQIHTYVYGWFRQEFGRWFADVQKSPGEFVNIANWPIKTDDPDDDDEANISFYKNMIEEIAHEVTPIILEGAKYCNEN